MTRKQRSDIDTERNSALVSDYIKGYTKSGKDGVVRHYRYTTVELVIKYGISQSRLYKILKDSGVPKRRVL